MNSKLHQFIFLFCLFRHCSSQDVFFPFGTAEGDSILPPADDGFTEPITLSTNFHFLKKDHSFLHVNTNGVLSFLRPLSGYSTLGPFPLTGTGNIIAPFWSDVDNSESGAVYFREILRHPDEDLTDLATNIVRDTFDNQEEFTATWLFIATWDDVSFYGSSKPYLNNTFQAVLVTNGNSSFTFLHFGDIVWTTGQNDGADSNGLGGMAAKVGFNAGDGINFYSLPGSSNQSIVDIETTTNVGTIGRWVFQVDEDIDDNGGEYGGPQQDCDVDCLNGGNCVFTDDASICQCPYGFVGPTCKRVAAYCTCG